MAAEIGLLPETLVHKTAAAGNTALSGAFLLGRALLAGEEIPRIDTGVRIFTLNLAETRGFEQLYIKLMDF